MTDEQNSFLSPTAESVRTARRYVRLFLDEPVAPPVAETAGLLTSEVVANADQNGGPHAPYSWIELKITLKTESGA